MSWWLSSLKFFDLCPVTFCCEQRKKFHVPLMLEISDKRYFNSFTHPTSDRDSLLQRCVRSVALLVWSTRSTRRRGGSAAWTACGAPRIWTPHGTKTARRCWTRSLTRSGTTWVVVEFCVKKHISKLLLGVTAWTVVARGIYKSSKLNY